MQFLNDVQKADATTNNLCDSLNSQKNHLKIPRAVASQLQFYFWGIATEIQHVYITSIE